MKNFIKVFCFIALYQSVSFPALAQYQADLVISPNNSQLVCPLAVKRYTVSNSNGSLPSCIYRWTATGGTISGASTGTAVDVKWNDEPGTGTLKVLATSCNPSSENLNSETVSYTRHSVFGQNFPSGACNNSIDVPLCSTAPFIICVNRMNIQGTGGFGQPPLKEVDAYIWFIPSGFKQASTTNVGPINVTTTINSLSLEPLTASGGTVSVRGTVKNSCGQSVSDSNPTNISKLEPLH